MFAKRFKNLRFNLLLPVCAVGVAAGGWLVMSGQRGASPAGMTKDAMQDERYAMLLQKKNLHEGHRVTNFTEAADSAALADRSRHNAPTEAGLGEGMLVTQREPALPPLKANAGAVSRSGALAADAGPVMAVVDGAVEVTVPVYASSGKTAVVPVALALAADQTALPAQMRAEMEGMAMDFLEAVAVDAGTTDAADAAYLRSWQAATRQSDQEFKMRYGRVAYVHMNLLTTQEAALNAR